MTKIKKCPICNEKLNETEIICKNCGYDKSMDYESYPTLQPKVGKNYKTNSVLKDAYLEKENRKKEEAEKKRKEEEQKKEKEQKLQSDYLDMKERAMKLEQEIRSLKPLIAGQVSQNNRLAEQNREKEEKISALEIQLSLIEEEKRALSEKMVSLQNINANLYAQLREENSNQETTKEVERLVEEKKALESDKANLQGKVNILQGNVNKLKESVEAPKKLNKVRESLIQSAFLCIFDAFCMVVLFFIQHYGFFGFEQFVGVSTSDFASYCISWFQYVILGATLLFALFFIVTDKEMTHCFMVSFIISVEIFITFYLFIWCITNDLVFLELILLTKVCFLISYCNIIIDKDLKTAPMFGGVLVSACASLCAAAVSVTDKQEISIMGIECAQSTLFVTGIASSIYSMVFGILYQILSWIYYKKLQGKRKNPYRRLLISLLIVIIASSICVYYYLYQKLCLNDSIVQVGDTVAIGKFELDGDLSNGNEDIQWTVVDVSDGKAYLLCNTYFGSMTYGKSKSDNSWENSVIRDWLNSDFYEEIFGEEEKSVITTTKLLTTRCLADESGINLFEDKENTQTTRDNVFIPSFHDMVTYEEVSRGLSSKVFLNAKEAESLETNEVSDLKRDYFFWTREQYGKGYVFIKERTEDVSNVSYILYDRICMVRPMLYISSKGLSLKEGDTYSFGKYEQDADPSNGSEKLDWTVMAVEEDRILLLCNVSICPVQYTQSETDLSWEKSYLRTWLNETFYEEAFTKQEKARICEAEIVTRHYAAYLEFDKIAYEDYESEEITKDKVFVPSYFDKTEPCSATKSAIEKYKVVTSANPDDYTYACWIRNPYGENGDRNIEITISSAAGASKARLMIITPRAQCYVRPALYIDLAKYEKMLDNQKQ